MVGIQENTRAHTNFKRIQFRNRSKKNMNMKMKTLLTKNPKLINQFTPSESFEDFKLYTARRKSFSKNCPKEITTKMRTSLALAGFYNSNYKYSREYVDDRRRFRTIQPISKIPGVVTCFNCEVSLNNWEKTDNPWIEHAIHSPTCTFVKLTKGDKFIADCMTIQIRSEEEQKIQKKIEFQKLEETYNSKEKERNVVVSEPVYEAKSCSVCLCEEASIVYLPCKHVATCNKCAPLFSSCVICKELIDATMKVYI